MNKLSTMILICALGVFGLVAQSTKSGEASKVAGEWQLAVETPHGPVKGPMHIQQEGSKISGKCELEMFGNLALTGTVDGKKVSFSVEVQGPGTVTFAGTVDGDKMSGDTNPGGGTWTATRQ